MDSPTLPITLRVSSARHSPLLPSAPDAAPLRGPGRIPRRHRTHEGRRNGWLSLALIASLWVLALFAPACRPLPRADIVVLNGAEPSSLDPLLVTGIEELRAVLPLFEGLTRPDPTHGRAIPGIAQSWTLSPDGRTYLFQLRTNASWSTGQPIDARDVLYS
ncbi:MAG: hypothetical protein IT580_14725, partial [Verrucomicrobiales bacterium]|nr:hypothetical protein [Verrucomicrobiales bacterium]